VAEAALTKGDFFWAGNYFCFCLLLNGINRDMTTEQPTSTDSAARLLDILHRAKQHSGGTAAQAFAAVFEIDANDTAELYRRLSVCERTAQQLLELARSVTNDNFKKSFQKNIVSIIQVFTPRHLDGNWEEHKKRILDRDTHALQLCSDLLGQRFQEQLVDKDTLHDLSQKVDDLYSEVRDSDLDQNLKRTILDGLQAIRTAIHDYTVRGAEGLQEALSTAIGQYVIFNVYVNAQTQHDSAETTGNNKNANTKFELAAKYLNVLVGLGNLLKMAYHAGPQLVEYIRRMLPPPK
jgi:hypothetical protein